MNHLKRVRDGYLPPSRRAAEAGQPDAVSLRASGHAAEVAPAGGPRRGRLPDRSGGQRPAGRPDGGRHEGLAQDLEEDGGEVGVAFKGLTSQVYRS